MALWGVIIILAAAGNGFIATADMSSKAHFWWAAGLTFVSGVSGLIAGKSKPKAPKK